ncbi:hypothetical protein [Enterobacter sp. 22466]|uniref:hypothetical protein n=1 Tax=Enterobacter sp. 22466 TaxID=3453924 RepID=UPI003F878B1E
MIGKTDTRTNHTNVSGVDPIDPDQAYKDIVLNYLHQHNELPPTAELLKTLKSLYPGKSPSLTTLSSTLLEADGELREEQGTTPYTKALDSAACQLLGLNSLYSFMLNKAFSQPESEND